MPTATSIIVAASIWALSATPATAAQSSLDAYGGQAAVLGKPAHVHQTSGSPAAKPGPTASPSGSQARNRGSDNAAGSASGGAPGPPAPPGPRGGSGAPRSSSGPLPSRTSASPALSVPSTASPDQGVSGLRRSGASLPFSWSDALALAAGGLGLALVGVGIRRLARTPV
jgi:hypothetical protein